MLHVKPARVHLRRQCLRRGDLLHQAAVRGGAGALPYGLDLLSHGLEPTGDGALASSGLWKLSR